MNWGENSGYKAKEPHYIQSWYFQKAGQGDPPRSNNPPLTVIAPRSYISSSDVATCNLMVGKHMLPYLKVDSSDLASISRC